ncbi:MBOAT family O-acyltransferase [Mordavella massiliensis]|jgi:alginate O-acetyltransferase complex protein AlgI|uniref:MBOAT family protein n=1 Tax=Mordavella massiliensis TaxID=1871024 RepID=A0A938X2H4_9CLOT|nr:MBOAT family protein [Mordavella massiliensis]MBM6826768.1 MBOAT family protein [Mordavella massiliensis]HJB87735.1 MBOAT family protein [Candidatus Dorea faecigallinarum]
MLFSSIVFLFTFLPIVLILYYVLPRQFKNPVLLLASLLFYAWGEPIYLFLMMFSILFNYISGLDIARNLGNKRAARKSLIFNVVVNLCVLGFFKYEGFVLNSLNAVLPVEIPFQEVALPVGISFYTFQILSYIIDVYWGNVPVQKNLMDFALYVTMFPQLIAGPIVKYAEIDEQLHVREENWGRFGEGVMYFIRGLAKKVLLANTVGMIYTNVSGMAPEDVSVVTAWLGCLAYTFQIYFDFSGYSDMAVGLGKMFGFEFPWNFNYPYIAQSVTEFWRRWHISLSSWFREYVYIPLGGNRVPVPKHIRNLLVVWLLTGLWHGAAWNFVAWGLYYGVILIFEKYFFHRVLDKLPEVLRHIYSLVLVMVGWVLFFSPSFAGALEYLKLMFGAGGHGFMDGEALYLLISNLGLWVIAIVSSTPLVYGVYERYVGRRKPVADVVIYAGMFLLCVAYLVTETYNPFLYFRF